MELSEWFDYQLQSTLDGFIWAVEQLPAERLYAIPPTALGEWTAAGHVFHMIDYVKRLALPSMYQWLGAPPVIPEEAKENPGQDSLPIEEMLAQFKGVRETEITLLPKFNAVAWESKQKTAFWGEVSLFWLVCKTYQHTNEHTHDILRLSLFWDRITERQSHGQ